METAELVDKQQEVATIGKRLKSETLYPQAYLDPESSITYFDMPGFMETRGGEEALFVSIGIRMSIKLAAKIRAVMVIIDHKTIITDKGAGFILLSQSINQLFKDPQNILDSILFVVTHAAHIDKKEVIEDINDIIEARKESAAQSILSLGNRLISRNDHNFKKKQDEIENNKKIIEVLNLISFKNYHNMVLIDVFDDFQSRNAITDLLCKLKPAPFTEFNLPDNDTDMDNFKDVVIDMAWDGLNLIKNRTKLLEDIQIVVDKINEKGKETQFINDQLKSLQESNFNDSEAVRNERDTFKQLIKKNLDSINKLKGSRIYVMPKLPDSINEYKNTYIFVMGDPSPYLFYIDTQAEKKMIYVTPDKFNAILGEIEGISPITYTLKEQSDLLCNLLPKNNRESGMFNFTDYHGIRMFYIRQKLPNNLDSYRNSWIFLIGNSSTLSVNSNSNTQIQSITNPQLLFINKTSVVTEHPLDIETFNRIMFGYGSIDYSRPLNETLSEAQLAAFRDMIAWGDPEHSSAKHNIMECEGKIKCYTKELKDLDSEKAELHWEDSIYDKRNIFGSLFNYHTEKEFVYNGGLPIKKLEELSGDEKDKPLGKFEDRVLDEAKGVYKSIFRSERGKNGIATVKIYVERRNKPDNKSQMIFLNEAIKKETDRLSAYLQNIKTLEKERQSLESTLGRYDSETRNQQKLSFGNRQREIESEINVLTGSINDLKRKLQRIEDDCAEHTRARHLICVNSRKKND